jgi:hypothetical protein
VRVIRFPSFAALPASYQQLFEKAGAEWYDYSLAWFQNFVQTALDDGDKVCIYGVERNGESNDAVAALATRYREKPVGAFSPRELSSLANFYTISFGPTGDNSSDDWKKAMHALAQTISSESPRWDCVHLRPLDPASALYPTLVKSFQDAGMVVQTYSCFGNWYLPVEGVTFDGYFNTLPPAMQNTIRRKSKKLEKTGRARIDVITGLTGLEPAIEAYEHIYLSSWKRPEPYPDFVSGLIHTLASRGWLRMGIVYLDNQPIAAQVWIVNAGRATIYKLAHDKQFDEFSAGSILTSRLIQHVLDVDKVSEIDFGSGDDPYKKNWLPKCRERLGILAMNPRSLRGCLSIVRHVGGRAAKSAWQSFRSTFRKLEKPEADKGAKS